MFPDHVLIRLTLRVIIQFFNLIAPLSFLWCLLAVACYPAPPLIIFFASSPIDHLFAYDGILQLLTWWCALECTWRVIHGVRRSLIASGVWDLKRQADDISTEERFRLWIKMLESTEDPWEWLGGMFIAPGYKRAAYGMRDPAVTSVKMEEVGKTNVQEFIAHFLFGKLLRTIEPKSLERAELRSMFLLLELVISRSRGAPFEFPRTRTRHRPLLLSIQPIPTVHHPLLFYVLVLVASGLGNTALFLAGFRYYGAKPTAPFPLFFMRRSRRALDRVMDPSGAHNKSEEARLGDRINYWFHPGSEKAREEGLSPVLFFHGVSGTYGPTPMILMLLWWTGRPFFVPEYPYVTMRLNPPSSIVTALETTAAARNMLFRHGFSLPNPDSGESDDEDEWRKGKFVLCGHSLGSGPCAWLLRNAPDIVAGTVLIDPMSLFLFAGDAPRNFFRTVAKTSGELFFSYFTSELGIIHFLCRHLRWTDSVIFASQPAFPLPSSASNFIPMSALKPQNIPWEIPNYAPSISPCPQGPFPSILFYSELDCIVPVAKIGKSLAESGFDSTNLRIMPRLDHAAIILRTDWLKEVAKAIDQVALAAEAVEKKRWEDELIE